MKEQRKFYERNRLGVEEYRLYRGGHIKAWRRRKADYKETESETRGTIWDITL